MGLAPAPVTTKSSDRWTLERLRLLDRQIDVAERFHLVATDRDDPVAWTQAASRGVAVEVDVCDQHAVASLAMENARINSGVIVFRPNPMDVSLTSRFALPSGRRPSRRWRRLDLAWRR